MQELEYLLEKVEREKLMKISHRDNFTDIYEEYANIFLNKSSLKKDVLNRKLIEPLDKGIFLVEHDDMKLYDGMLWMSREVDYIGKMDYLFTVPMWDWWINPLFSRKTHRDKNKSILVIDKFEENEKECKKMIASEGFITTESYDLKHPTLELTQFYRYLDLLLPINFARELKRMSKFIDEFNPDKINFVLRGGYFLKEFFDFFKGKVDLLNPRDNGYQPNPNELYIDDCIGSTRTFSSLGFSGRETFNFCCLNSTLPGRVYQEYFPNVNFNLPSDLLNVYSCRLFEKNPRIIGLDYSKRGLHFYNNPVRENLISKVKNFLKTPNIEDKTYKFAMELINHGKK